MADEKYNGWTNRMTWLVNLHLTNTQATDSYWREAAKEARKAAQAELVDWTEETVYKRTRRHLADRLEQEIGDGATDICAGIAWEDTRLFWQDVLNSALGTVNWREIAEHFLEE